MKCVLMTTGLAALLLSACSITPIEPVDPGIALPPPSSVSATPLSWPAPDWWRAFGSEELNRLIAAAQQSNLDIAAATARVLQAEAQARSAGAALLPEVDLGASASRSGQIGNSAANDLGVSLSASYEIDFWGANRAGRIGALASLAASEFDKDTVAVTVTTAVANTYLEILSRRDQLAVARANLDVAERVLALVEARARFGAVSPLDLAQQRAAVAGQRSAIAPLQQQEQEARAALALLLGRLPYGFDVQATTLSAIALPDVTPGLPSDLLTRRPDLRSAERDLLAAQADIAVARAALLPSVRLTGSTSLSGANFAALFDNNPVYSLAAALTQPIFNGGRLAAQRDLVTARREELLHDYRNAILAAFGDVDNALASIGHLAEQSRWQAEVLQQAELSLDLAEKRYRAGADDLLTVLDSQRTLYEARDNLAQLRLARLQAVIALYKALGGGWAAENVVTVGMQHPAAAP